MKIRDEHISKSALEVWQIIVDYVIAKGSFTYVTGINYSAKFVGSCIRVRGGSPGTKRAGRGDYLTAKDFVKAYDVLKTFEEFNTNTIKPYISRLQTPFVGLLVCAGIIDK